MTAEHVRDAFRKQAKACRMLGSPLTGQICEILSDALCQDQGEVARQVLGWAGEPSSRGDAVPLRLCGGLHALVLTERDAALAEAYANGSPDSKILLQAIELHADYLLGWLRNAPQTNEVGRAAAIIAAAGFATGHCNLPIRALELGASAGLNLNFHRFELAPQGALPPSGLRRIPPGYLDEEEHAAVILRPEWTGELPSGQLELVEAEGVDLAPLDPLRDELKLLAYCWSDQPERMARLRAALAIARRYPPRVEAGDAGTWLRARLKTPERGRMTLVYHTIAWQYFPPETQVECEDALQACGALASRDGVLVHFAMEGDGGDGAAMNLRLWDAGGMRSWRLGRVDFHGRWLRWNPVPI